MKKARWEPGWSVAAGNKERSHAAETRRFCCMAIPPTRSVENERRLYGTRRSVSRMRFRVSSGCQPND
ncbi:MAG TPA: hypothetical protein VJJ72_01960, partial [Candidatus Paceibacterota bacterium]